MSDWYRTGYYEQLKENLAINPKRLASGCEPDALTLKVMGEWHPSFTCLLLQQLLGANLGKLFDIDLEHTDLQCDFKVK